MATPGIEAAVRVAIDNTIDAASMEDVRNLTKAAIEAYEEALAKQGKEIVFSAELKRLRQAASKYGV